MVKKAIVFVILLALRACPSGNNGENSEEEQLVRIEGAELSSMLKDFELILRQVPGAPDSVGFRLLPGGAVSNAAVVQCAPEVLGEWNLSGAQIVVQYAVKRPAVSELESGVGCRDETEALMAMTDMPSGEFSIKAIECKGPFDCRGTAFLSSGAQASLVVPGYPP